MRNTICITACHLLLWMNNIDKFAWQYYCEDLDDQISSLSEERAYFKDILTSFKILKLGYID